MEHFHSLEKIFNIVTEEQHTKLMVGREDHTESATTFAVHHDSKNQATREKVTCRHCERVGHKESSCYKIIRYPPKWNLVGKQEAEEKSPVVGEAAETEVEGETTKRLTQLSTLLLGSSRCKEPSSTKSP